MTPTAAAPEYNVTGQDYGDRRHFRYAGPPIIDVHAHVMQTRPEAKDGQPTPDGEVGTLAQARTMLDVAAEFGVGRIYSMCPPDDIPRPRAAGHMGGEPTHPDHVGEFLERNPDQYLDTRAAK